MTGEPFAIDYSVSPVPQNGVCAEASTGKYPAHNASVVLMSPRMPPLYTCSIVFVNLPDCCIRVFRPELRVPPPLTPEGEPVAPVPEKSFVQKYWIYMVVVLGALRESHLFLSPLRSTSAA